MLTPEQHDLANRMEETMNVNPVCKAFQFHVQNLREAVYDVVEPGERTLGLPTQAVVESGKVLVRNYGMDSALVGSLVLRELDAVAEKATEADMRYIAYWRANINMVTGGVVIV